MRNHTPQISIRLIPVLALLCACGQLGGSASVNGNKGLGNGQGTDGGTSGQNNNNNNSTTGTGGNDGGSQSGTDAGSAIDPNAFWANDPPPKYCPLDGGTSEPPQTPGGTPECPDDKNRQGCPCTTVGETASCWPGLRANRNLGICQDGVTTCMADGEFGQVWGECKGYVLPQQGATGKEACECFSSGRWNIENLSPCFISDGNGNTTDAVSTYEDSQGNAQCPSSISNPPHPQAGSTFSHDSLDVDCAGNFQLCYTLKAGNADSPQPTDCVLAKVCVEAAYPTAGVDTKLPDLPAWESHNSSCADAFAKTGGYGEMSVKGLSIMCDAIDDGSGNEKVFNRVQYCPLSCNDNPSAPECASCGQGGSGQF